MVRICSLLLILLCSMLVQALADCTCKYTDGEVKEGETACIKTAAGPRLARCGKSQNVSSWLLTDESCELTLSLWIKRPETVQITGICISILPRPSLSEKS